MRDEVDQLLEDLEYIRSHAGSVGPDHPKVKKWVSEVRDYLNRDGNAGELKKFDQLDFVKGGSQMWSQNTITQGNVRKYKADLDKVETMLEKMTKTSGQAFVEQRIKEVFFPSTDESTEKEIPVESQLEMLLEESPSEHKEGGREKKAGGPLSLENAMDQKIEPNFEAITKQHLSSSTRDQAVDQLMAELSTEMKSLDPDWEKIQRVMGRMMGLKKTGELLERLKAEANNPGVKWEAVQKIMAELWSINKEIVIGVLPALLKV